MLFVGLDTEDWVNNRLGGYVKMSIPDRREAVAELTADGDSNRSIAEVIGVDEITVRRDINAANVADPDNKGNGDNRSDDNTATNVASVVTTYTGEDEWYTPAPYDEACRSCELSANLLLKRGH